MERRKGHSYKAKKVTQTIRTISREIPLTVTDRITYVYVKDTTTDVIQEVINVSYEAWIEKGWLTILRYDSTHGYLHQHTRFSLTQEKEFISKEHILQAGSHQDWLTWAIEDIKTNFSAYRRSFFHRSNLDDEPEAY
jgi:competence CoiA-like predicted nuclease